jgi:hypothetical protein
MTLTTMDFAAITFPRDHQEPTADETAIAELASGPPGRPGRCLALVGQAGVTRTGPTPGPPALRRALGVGLPGRPTRR